MDQSEIELRLTLIFRDMESYQGEGDPEYRGRLHWQTTPSGLLVRQMQRDRLINLGNMTARGRPMFTGQVSQKVDGPAKQGPLTDPPVAYATDDHRPAAAGVRSRVHGRPGRALTRRT